MTIIRLFFCKKSNYAVATEKEKPRRVHSESFLIFLRKVHSAALEKRASALQVRKLIHYWYFNIDCPFQLQVSFNSSLCK